MSLIEQIAAQADKLVDQTDDKGGFEYKPPEAGPAYGRLVSYIEVGNHPQEFQGQAKAAAPECILEFELYGKRHIREWETKDDAGTVTKHSGYTIIRVGMGPSGGGKFSMPGGAKSNHYKLLASMNYGRTIKNMASMLGEAFLLEVIHSDNGKEGKEKRVYANLRDSNGWKIGAPRRINEEGDTVDVKVPEPTVELKALIWDYPTVEMWNSIHIPGTVTRKVDGKEVEVSKNYIQEYLKTAVNFKGSAVEQIVSQLAGDLPESDFDPADLEPAPAPADEVDDLDNLDLGGAPDASDGAGEETGGGDDPLEALNL